MSNPFLVLPARLLTRRLSVVIPIAYMILLLVIATVPTAEGSDQTHVLWFFAFVPSTIQNLLHIPAYGVLAFLWRWALNTYMAANSAVFITFSLAVGFGVFQEWCQSMVPGRFASLTDVIFNTFGAVIGLWVHNRFDQICKSFTPFRND